LKAQCQELNARHCQQLASNLKEKNNGYVSHFRKF
jgi:hypothetical protein